MPTNFDDLKKKLKEYSNQGLTAAFGGGTKPENFSDPTKMEPTLAEPTVDPVNLLGGLAASKLSPMLLKGASEAMPMIKGAGSALLADEAGTLGIPAAGVRPQFNGIMGSANVPGASSMDSNLIAQAEKAANSSLTRNTQQDATEQLGRAMDFGNRNSLAGNRAYKALKEKLRNN